MQKRNGILAAQGLNVIRVPVQNIAADRPQTAVA